MRKYVFYVGGLLVLEGIAIGLALSECIRVHSLIVMGLYWLWTGAFMMLDRLPGKDNGRFDRWEKQVYGLSLGVMGLGWTAFSFTPWPYAPLRDASWIPMLLTLVPPALIALAGRFWYVEKKRNDDYYKNQTEKD